MESDQSLPRKPKVTVKKRIVNQAGKTIPRTAKNTDKEWTLWKGTGIRKALRAGMRRALNDGSKSRQGNDLFDCEGYAHICADLKWPTGRIQTPPTRQMIEQRMQQGRTPRVVVKASMETGY